jgi:hypothetical protein
MMSSPSPSTRYGASGPQLCASSQMRAAADGDGSFLRQQFVSGVLREVSGALCRLNGRIEQTVAGHLAVAMGRAFMPGVERPTAEVGA